MSGAGRRRCALAVAAALALVPSPAPAADVAAAADAAEREAALLEERLATLERLAEAPAESDLAAARRRFHAGEERFAVGDWSGAALATAAALDEPAFRATADHPAATFLLAEALRRDGACGAARPRYAEYVALGPRDRRGEALAGALDCAVKERRHAEADRLALLAEEAFGREAPAEVRYLAAKALAQRTDLPAADRIVRATAAFERVGPPFHLQASYFQGTLAIEEGDLPAAIARFTRCVRAEPDGARQAEVRELCWLALARIHAEQGNAAMAISWYSGIRGDSPRFAEAMHELAWAHVRARDHEQAVRTSSLVTDLTPRTALAPEARLLQGHLLLRLGRHAEAAEAFDAVHAEYAPLRDALDEGLARSEDPLAYLGALAGAPAGVKGLSPVASRWATASRDVGAALELVTSVGDARREVEAAAELAGRLEALLERGDGLDAFPATRRAHAHAQALQNAAAWREGAIVAALSARVGPALPPARRAELSDARRDREEAEASFSRLPRTSREVEERLGRGRAAVDGVARSVHRLQLAVESCRAAIAATEAAIAPGRSGAGAGPELRRDLEGELRSHRDIVEGYEGALRRLRDDVAGERSTEGGSEAAGRESRIREAYARALEREEAAAAAVPPAARELAALERARAVRERLARVRARAAALGAEIVADASRRAAALRERVRSERLALAAERDALEAIQREGRHVLGRIAARSMRELRGRVNRLVLEADVGAVDVAWSRKRQLLEQIQQLSSRKTSELDQLDREYGGLLQEGD